VSRRPDDGHAAPADPAQARGDSAGRPTISRRALLTRSGLVAAGAATAGLAGVLGPESTAAAVDDPASAIPFYGPHQAGITTPVQQRLVLAAFDVTGSRADLVDLLAAWTDAAARLTAGEPLEGATGAEDPPSDTGEAAGLPASRLTLTLGFGPTLFDDRLGRGARRPAAREPLPPFPGDALAPARSDGDLCIQACADDPQVAFHAVHNLTRLGLGTVQLRWMQSGFGPTASAGPSRATPRNLLGFRDGTRNLDVTDPGALRRHVWVQAGSDQAWMTGGTYLVARRIRTHLEQWDRSPLAEQERTIGRVRATGAPLGSRHEHDPVDLAALDSHGMPHIPDGAHIRQAAPATNHGAALLRRGYSYADGMDPASGELDAGLLFLCFQQDPRTQFVAIQQRLAGQDALHEYLTHTASALFACPPGARPGRPWGHGLI
jgi:deferrochelatase/peroxidase EfeB